MQFARTAVVLGFAAAFVVACSSSSSEDGQDEDAAKGIVTYSNTIQPLVQEKCVRCHRDGGIAPFSLETYEKVKAMGDVAKGKVERREMPPWGAFSDPTCEMKHKFKDDLSLSQAQVDSFVKWVDTGMPIGKASANTNTTQPSSFTNNVLVDKTNTYDLGVPYAVEAGGKDDIRCFPIDPGFAEDTWIGGSNIVPGDPKVVHHVIVYVDSKREGMTKAGAAGNYPCFGGPDVSSPSLLLAWAPGVTPTTYGEEAGLKIPKNSHLVMQVHYHPGAASTTDKTTLELKKLGYKPGYVAQVVLAGNAQTADDGDLIKLLPGPNDPATGPAFVIPPNVDKHTETMELVVPEKIGDINFEPVGVYATGSHMHWAGVDMKVQIDRKVAVENQPQNECLLSTPKYDFNWQRTYAYDEPLDKLPLVSAGDKVRFTCTYNNTTGNRFVQKAMTEQRMSSPPEIKLGETTLDEMCLGVLVLVRRASLLD